jgi:curved DNA-binding protein CbpA
MREHYIILESKETDSLDDIKVRYVRLIKVYHSDVNSDPAAVEKSKKINAAWTWMKKSHIPYKPTNHNYTQSDKTFRHSYTNYNKFDDENYNPYKSSYFNNNPKSDQYSTKDYEQFIKTMFDFMEKNAAAEAAAAKKKEESAPSLNLYFTRSQAKNHFIEIPQAIVDHNSVIINIIVDNTIGVVVLKKGEKLPYNKPFKNNVVVYVVNSVEPLPETVYLNPLA